MSLKFPVLIVFMYWNGISMANAQNTYEECRATVMQLNAESAEEAYKRDDCFNETYGGSKMNCRGLNIYQKNKAAEPSRLRDKSLMDQSNKMQQACNGILDTRMKKQAANNEQQKNTTTSDRSMVKKYEKIHSGAVAVQKDMRREISKQSGDKSNIIGKIQDKAMADVRKSHKNTLKETEKLADDIKSTEIDDEQSRNGKKTVEVDGAKSF